MTPPLTRPFTQGGIDHYLSAPRAAKPLPADMLDSIEDEAIHARAREWRRQMLRRPDIAQLRGGTR